MVPVNKYLGASGSIAISRAIPTTSNALDFSEIQKMTISKEQFLEVMYISAMCHFELGEYEVTRVCLDQIINYPDFNHNYISKAEALKKQLMKAKDKERGN